MLLAHANRKPGQQIPQISALSLATWISGWKRNGIALRPLTIFLNRPPTLPTQPLRLKDHHAHGRSARATKNRTTAADISFPPSAWQMAQRMAQSACEHYPERNRDGHQPSYLPKKITVWSVWWRSKRSLVMHFCPSTCPPSLPVQRALPLRLRFPSSQKTTAQLQPMRVPGFRTAKRPSRSPTKGDEGGGQLRPIAPMKQRSPPASPRPFVGELRAMRAIRLSVHQPPPSLPLGCLPERATNT